MALTGGGAAVFGGSFVLLCSMGNAWALSTVLRQAFWRLYAVPSRWGHRLSPSSGRDQSRPDGPEGVAATAGHRPRPGEEAPGYTEATVTMFLAR